MSFLNLMKNRLKPREVNNALSEVSGDVSELETAVAAIIPKLPKDYSSTEEVNTGQKWIDGKDIYMKYFSGTLPVLSTTGNVTIIENFHISSFVKSEFHLMRSEYSDYYLTSTSIAHAVTSDSFFMVSCPQSFSELPWSGFLFYTKPDPVPATQTKSKKKNNS